METVDNVDVKQEPETRNRAPALPIEDEPEYDDTLCILDWYNSDLNLKIVPTDFCSAVAMSSRGFGYMWAGARATQGASRGRVCYEVRIDNNQPTTHLANETTPNVLRCGWSVSSSDLQLGEVKYSYGFGGTGKISEDCKFRNYGKKFSQGDVVGCYLDMNADPVIIKYTINGVEQGVAFRINKSELDGQPLFPHILTKNQDFTVNFGQMPGPMFPLIKGYTPIGQLDFADGIRRGPIPPDSRGECEALMMIGLPGAGKTYWAEKLKKENPEKNFNILGTNNLIEKMKIDGLSRKRNYSGRWEELIKLCTECFNQILDLATKRRRNYILDQTNVYPTARGRKMKPFSGFQCKAIVVVPNDQEFRRRVQERESIEGKEVPDAAVVNMKANFVLPEVEETFFSSIFYTEMGPSETQAIVSQYNAEAITMGQKPTAGVVSFKSRNEQKRAAKNQVIPGALWRGNDAKPPQLMKVEREEPQKDDKSRAIAIKSETKPQQQEQSTRDRSKERRSEKIRSRGNSPIKRKRTRSRSSGNRRNRSNSRDRYRKSRSSERNRRHRTRSRSRSKGFRARSRSRSFRDRRRQSRSQERQRERRRSRSPGRNNWRKETNPVVRRQDQPSPWIGGQPFASNRNFNANSDNQEQEFNKWRTSLEENNMGETFPQSMGTQETSRFDFASCPPEVESNRGSRMDTEPFRMAGNMGRGMEDRGNNMQNIMGREQTMGFNNFPNRTESNIGRNMRGNSGENFSQNDFRSMEKPHPPNFGDTQNSLRNSSQQPPYLQADNIQSSDNQRFFNNQDTNQFGNNNMTNRGGPANITNNRGGYGNIGGSGHFNDNSGGPNNMINKTEGPRNIPNSMGGHGNLTNNTRGPGDMINNRGGFGATSRPFSGNTGSRGNLQGGPGLQNLQRKSLLGAPPPIGDTQSGAPSNENYHQEERGQENRNDNQTSQQRSWKNQQSFQSQNFQSNSGKEQANFKNTYQSDQSKYQNFGNNRPQGNLGQTASNERFENVGRNRMQTDFRNEKKGNEFNNPYENPSNTYDQSENANLNSQFNPVQPNRFGGQDNTVNMRELESNSDQAMYQRRENRTNQSYDNFYGKEESEARNMRFGNKNNSNVEFGRLGNEMNNEKHLSGNKNQSSRTGRSDYSDEYNIGYQGGQQNRNFQNQFSETNQRPGNSGGNYFDNNEASFKEMGSNMEMDEYDEQGMSGEPFRHTNYKMEGSFQSGNHYESTEIKGGKRPQMHQKWNPDNEVGFQRRENPFPGPGAASRNVSGRNESGRFGQRTDSGDYGGGPYSDNRRFSQTKQYEEEEEGYEDERSHKVEEKYDQDRMRGNRWGQGSGNRNNQEMQREAPNRKSFGDRRMERDFSSGLVKNPFDPSNRVGTSKPPRFDQMDDEQYDVPCMNPPAPDPAEPPVPPSGGGADGAGGSAGGGAGGPDYAKLLQYLQYYQNQMGSKKS